MTLKISNYKIDLSFIREIWIILSFFLFFYNIPLHYLGFPISSGKFIALLGLVLFILHIWKKREFKINKNYWHYILLVNLTFLVTFLIIKIIHYTEDSYYFRMLFFYISEYVLGSFYLVKILKNVKAIRVIDSLIVIGVVQALIMIIAVFFPPLKHVIYDFQDADPASHSFSKLDQMREEAPFRGLALASDNKLGLAIFFSILLFLILISILLKKRKGNVKDVLAFLLIFAGGLLSGRIFFIGLFFLVIFLTINYFIKPNRKYLTGFFKRFFIAVFILIFSLVIFFNQLPAKQKLLLSQFSGWAFELFINYYDGKGFSSDSSKELLTKHLSVFPEDSYTLIIGDQDRTMINGVHHIGKHTDSGFIRMIYFIGIIGCIFYLLIWTNVLYSLINLYKNLYLKIFFISYFIYLLIAQVKYDVFPSSSLNFKVFILFLVFAVFHSIKENPSLIS